MAHARIADVDDDEALRHARRGRRLHRRRPRARAAARRRSTPMVATRPLLAREVVRYVGEPIAVVVTERPTRARTPPSSSCVDYDPLPAVVDPEAALPDEIAALPRRGTNVVRRLAHMGVPPERDDLFDGCEVVVTRAARQPARRAVPARGRGRRRGVGRRPARTTGRSTQNAHGVHDVARRIYGLERPGPGHHARRRRRLRRQDRRVPRGAAARRARRSARPAGALARPAPRTCWPSATAGPSCQRDHHRRHPRRQRAGLPPRRSCRTPAPTRASASILPVS